jgi:hypothetical protein
VTFVDREDNELLALEVVHHFVEILDRYFGNVCELDLIFNFHKASLAARASASARAHSRRRRRRRR